MKANDRRKLNKRPYVQTTTYSEFDQVGDEVKETRVTIRCFYNSKHELINKTYEEREV